MNATPACRGAPPQLFDSVDTLSHQRARVICATCPCVMACLEVALNIAGEHPHNPNRRGPHGTWGGLLWMHGRVRPLNLPDCGTERGYFNHIQRHETTCGACRAAHAEGERQRNRQRHLPPVERRTRVIAQRPARYPQGPVDEVLPCTPTAAHDESTNADEGDQADGA